MDKQKLEIGHPLKIAVYWYDKVPEPPRSETYEGEVISWKESQIVVRVPGYAVVRFWKKNGAEVNNSDHERRGFRVDLKELSESVQPSSNNNQEGVEIDMPVAIDTDA